MDLGYTFQNKELLALALTHTSLANEKRLESNQRLEFLGDGILSFVIATELYTRFPELAEGRLTEMRAATVCEKALAAAARKLNLGSKIRFGKSETVCGGKEKDSILADAVESVLAACYLDGGIEAASSFVRRFVLVNVPVKQFHNADYKTALQELIQQKKTNHAIVYRLAGESGPDHDKQFQVELLLDGEVIGSGIGSSKKRAEQEAAKAALEKLS